jgi:hypothetical protein
MKKAIMGIALAAILATGCTGSFSLTNELYQFHREKDRWVDEILFLVFAITPVYGTVMLADAIVLNSIEFWTGDNPLEARDGGAVPGNDREVTVGNGEESLTMRYDSRTQKVEVNPGSGTGEPFYLTRTESGVIATDREGEVLCYSTKDSLGGITVYDVRTNSARYYPPEVVEHQRNGLLK